MASFTTWDIGACNCGPAPGVYCVTCTGPIPLLLYVTDARGTYTATWNSGVSLWTTPALCSGAVSPTAGCVGGHATCGGGVSAGVFYTYSIGCTSANHMTLNRYWYELACSSPAHQYAPCSCLVSGAQAYASSGSKAVTCGSVHWSGTLTRVSGNLADPVGGTTSFTQ